MSKPGKVTVVNKYKEPNHIYCGRGSAFGNPFVMDNESQRDTVCDQFKEYFDDALINNQYAIDKVNELVERVRNGEDINLGCFCAPKRCHCDYIKQVIEERL